MNRVEEIVKAVLLLSKDGLISAAGGEAIASILLYDYAEHNNDWPSALLVASRLGVLEEVSNQRAQIEFMLEPHRSDRERQEAFKAALAKETIVTDPGGSPW